MGMANGSRWISTSVSDSDMGSTDVDSFPHKAGSAHQKCLVYCFDALSDGNTISVCGPVQASIAANTWVVSGAPQTKKLQDILPGIINQLGPDNLDNLRKLAEQFQKQSPGAAAAAGATATQEEDDDEVPELVPGETFEAAAEEGHKS
ncbi:basic transcription factor 3 [Eucalyptus grandis]|nr:basic transcription factor 3 [Eucalyptus grandis]